MGTAPKTEAKTTAAKTGAKTTAAKMEEKTTAAKTEAKTTAAKTEAKTTAAKTEEKITEAKTEAKTTAAKTEAKSTMAKTTEENLVSTASQLQDDMRKMTTEINTANANMDIANGGKSTIEETQKKLDGGSNGRYAKRQDTNNDQTTMQVMDPKTCDEFKKTWLALLKLAKKPDDKNLDQINLYINAIKNIDVLVICDQIERKSIANEGKTDFESATIQLESYAKTKARYDY